MVLLTIYFNGSIIANVERFVKSRDKHAFTRTIILAEKAQKRITPSDSTLRKRAAATAIWTAVKRMRKGRIVSCTLTVSVIFDRQRNLNGTIWQTAPDCKGAVGKDRCKSGGASFRPEALNEPEIERKPKWKPLLVLR
ncbi:hypothetical protein ALC56_02896 [Trachymyrmex septentrionalis]|uniref:Uncharacterized protein n=1 Tax=Trachymyrmex septentrionalis TaxID=34720 RepID=A0A151K029_9HYME|nr:hypothetical protein ALC56_02896 [Trachymyrmex septentrionalis]